MKSYVPMMVAEAEAFFGRWGEAGEVDLKVGRVGKACCFCYTPSSHTHFSRGCGTMLIDV